MKKKTWIILGVIFLILVIIGGCFYQNYHQKNFQESLLLIPETEMEQGFTEIVNNVIQEQAQKVVVVSIDRISVGGVANGVIGSISLNCKKRSYEDEEEIIGSIANKLFDKYPNDFGEERERSSFAHVCCYYRAFWRAECWRIEDGSYGRTT
jgi:hypothetical protein